MNSIMSRFLILCLFAHVAWSDRDVTVCNVPTESCGLIPPTLPTNFILKGEFVDYVNKSMFWHEVYFDSLNLIGKYVINSVSMQFNYIFDYEIGQIVEYMRIHPGARYQRDPLSDMCKASSIEKSPLKYIFGYKNSFARRTHMFNSYEVMRFGGEYQYSANGTKNLEKRGLRTNKFRGCIYDSSIDATLGVNYYFADSNILTSTTPLLVQNKQPNPVKVEMQGVYPKGDKKMQFNISESISWFQPDPVFSYDTFKIPQGLFCKDYRGNKRIPDFPITFSARLERSAFTENADGEMMTAMVYLYEEIWYDAENGLARRDFTPQIGRDSEYYNKFGNKGQVKTIFDFNTGVLYVVNKASGRCYARPIQIGDYFDTSKEIEFIAMGSPEEIFLMERDQVEYKGKDFVRDIETDVFSAKSQMQFSNESYLETYFATNGWHEDADEAVQYGVPIRHTVSTTQMVNGNIQKTTNEMNFFKFKASKPPLVMYDVTRTSCIDIIDRAYLGIKLQLIPDDLVTIMKYSFYFNEAFQYYIADIAQIMTPLRVQNVNVQEVESDDTLNHMITFVLLERTPLKVNVPFAQKGVDLKTGIANLAAYIDSGNFTVLYKDADGKEHYVKANPGSFGRFNIMTANAPANVEEETLKSFESIRGFPRKKRDTQFIWFADDVKDKPKIVKGMSPGGLAGLSIAMLIIGIGVGVGLMYYYIRRYSDQSIRDQYAMQKR